MKLYICHTDVSTPFCDFHEDRAHFLKVIQENCAGKLGSASRSGLDLASITEAETLEQCDVYVALGGMYISRGFQEPMLEQLRRAAELGKHILVVRPFGTGYVPAGLRPYAEQLCFLDRDSIVETIPQI